MELDAALLGRVGVGVQLDEGVGDVGEPVDLAGRREHRGADKREVLVAGQRVVGVDVGEVEHVALRTAVVDDVVRADLGDGRPQERVAAAVAAQAIPRPPMMTFTPSLPVMVLWYSLPIRSIAVAAVGSVVSRTSTSEPGARL